MVEAYEVSSGACPTFFRGLRNKARIGGRNSYRSAGYETARHLADLVNDAEDIGELERLFSAEEPDRIKVLGWLRARLPHCMKLVPYTRQKTTFMEGFEE